MHGSVHTPPYSPANAHMNSPRNLQQAKRSIDPREMRQAPPNYKRINSFEFEARVAPFLYAHQAELAPRASPTHRTLAAAHAHHAAVAAYYHAHQDLVHRDLPSLSPPPRRDFELISDDGLRSTPPPQNVHTPTHAAAALAAAAHGHPITRARAPSTPPIARDFRPARSPPAVGDGPIERLGDELLVAAAATGGGARHAHHRAASAAAVSLGSPAAKRSVFDEPPPLMSQHLQDNYLRPKSSSVDAALPPLNEFSVMRIAKEPLLDMDSRAAAAGSSLSHLRAPPTHPSKLRHGGGGFQHQRAQSHGIMGTQGLRLRGSRSDKSGRAAEAPARVPSEESDDGRPPMPSASKDGGLAGGLLPYKRRKRGRRPSAQAQREKRETKRSVYLSPLPAGASFETVRDLLKEFGGLQTVEFIEDGKSCYARFESYPQADRAVEAGAIGDGVIVMPKKLRVEEVKELQESLAELDAKKKLLQERLGPLATDSIGALATAGGLSSTSGIARANALRESGRGHQRHASNPTGTRFGGGGGGGASGHHRFSSNPPIGVQALSAGKALRHGGKGGGSSRKSSLHGSGAHAAPSAPPPPGLSHAKRDASPRRRVRRAVSCHEFPHAYRHFLDRLQDDECSAYSYGGCGRRGGDRSGANSRRSSTSGGNKGGANGVSAGTNGTNDRPSKYGTNSRRSSLTSEQLEGSWRGGGGSAHRRAYSDMNPLNAPQRGSRFGGHGPSHSNNLAPPSAGAYQPPQVQQQKQQAAQQQAPPPAQVSGKKFTVAQASVVATANADSKNSSDDVSSEKVNAGANGVSITVTGPQRARGDSADSASTLSPPGPAGSRGGVSVVVNGPSAAHGTGLAAVSVASRPGSRRGSLAAVAKTAKGPDGTKGFNWKQSNNAAK